MVQCFYPWYTSFAVCILEVCGQVCSVKVSMNTKQGGWMFMLHVSYLVSPMTIVSM